MTRSVEFDLDKAIDKATLIFWKKGYTNTSLRDLLKVMDIGEGSFYNTFKSKKQLYLKCLDRYNSTVGHRRLIALQSGKTAGAGIRAFFSRVLDDLEDPKTPRVCLVAASMSGDVLDERDLKAPILLEMRSFIRLFEGRLNAALDAGELPKNFDVHTVAQLLVTYLQGMFRMIRVVQTRKQTEQQLEAILRGFGL